MLQGEVIGASMPVDVFCTIDSSRRVIIVAERAGSIVMYGKDFIPI